MHLLVTSSFYFKNVYLLLHRPCYEWLCVKIFTLNFSFLTWKKCIILISFVQNIPCRTKGCKSTVLPKEATTPRSRPLAKANQRAKVTRCCQDTVMHPQLIGAKVAWLSFHKSNNLDWIVSLRPFADEWSIFFVLLTFKLTAGNVYKSIRSNNIICNVSGEGTRSR